MEKIIIYIAGKPDGYPLEYYDPETGTYNGVIPRLLKEFSERTEYDVRYYAAGKEDMRQQLADNLQVDLISACMETEDFRHREGGRIILLETMTEGQRLSFGFYFSETAPEILADDLNSFLAGETWEEKTGLLLEEAEKPPAGYRRKMEAGTVAWFFFLAAVMVGLALIAGRQVIRRKKLWKTEETDRLTGIGNREFFMRIQKSVIHDGNRILYRMFYFSVDMESMERLQGRKKTEEFLRHMAAVLVKSITDGDIAARVCDDGFAVLRLSPGEQEAKEWILSVMRRLRGYFTDSDSEQAGYVTAGIYKLKVEDHDIKEVMVYAAKSAQAARREGTEYKIGTDAWLASYMEEQRLLEDMETGLNDEEFDLYIQCCVEANSGRIAGGQALSRWEHPEKGFLLPGRYVPLMEQEGMIGRLDYYLLEKVCIFLEQLHNMGIEDFPVYLKFSEKTLEEKNVSERCVNIIINHTFPRNMLILGVAKCQTRDSLNQIKGLGVRTMAEVFKNGFSQFFDGREHLVDVFWLDKDLIDYGETAQGHVVMKHIIQMGHELGISVWAKGVENEGQAAALQEMGCDILQGFYFHYPVLEWEIKRVLTMEAVYEA